MKKMVPGKYYSTGRKLWLMGVTLLYLMIVVIFMTMKIYGSSLKENKELDSVLEHNEWWTEELGPRIKRDFSDVKLDEEPSNCTPRAVNNFPGNFFTLKETQDGGVFLHILIALYLFAALAIVCDDYFVPSLERICEDLGIQEDVAGATFMAAGSSAPELCTSIVGVFIAKSDVGVGTIVGSAVFNILFIIGICGLYAGMVVQLTWYPLMRDTLFYLLSVIVLAVVIHDEKVYWYESVVMVLLYAVYILIMYFNRRLERRVLSSYAKIRGVRSKPGSAPDSETRPLLEESVKTNSYVDLTDSLGKNADQSRRQTKENDNDEEAQLNENGGRQGGRLSQSTEVSGIPSKSTDESERPSGELLETRIHIANELSKSKSIEEEDEYESPWKIPESFFIRIYWVAMLPIKVLYYFTVPDCRRPGKWRRLYPLTFTFSVVWIAAFTYILVWMVTIAGDALEIPDTVMGLTLLAAGTSLPDCLASMLVARDGLGDMAVSNSIGSNVFDILICLGIPWFIETTLIDRGTESLPIKSSGLLYSTLTLLATVAFILISIAVNRWRLTKFYGCVCIVTYILVITLSSLYELNIFGQLNPDSCPR